MTDQEILDAVNVVMGAEQIPKILEKGAAVDVATAEFELNIVNVSGLSD